MLKNTVRIMLICTVIAVSCGKKEYTSSPGTPSHTVETLIMAIEDEDVDLCISVFPVQFREEAKKSRALIGDKFDDIMKQQLGANKDNLKGAYVNGEKIEGDKAQVTVSDSSGSTDTIPCIKEADRWVIDLKK